MKKLTTIAFLFIVSLVSVLIYIKTDTDINAEIKISPIQKEGEIEFILSNFGDDIYFFGYDRSSPLVFSETERNGIWKEDAEPANIRIWNYKYYLKKGQSIRFKADNYGDVERWRLKVLVYKNETKPDWYTKVAEYLNLKIDNSFELYSPVVTVDSLTIASSEAN